MEPALTYAFERDEPVASIEVLWPSLGVCDDANTTDMVTLVERQTQHMSQQQSADTKPLSARVYTQPRQPKNRERVGWQTSTQAFGWEVFSALCWLPRRWRIQEYGPQR